MKNNLIEAILPAEGPFAENHRELKSRPLSAAATISPQKCSFSSAKICFLKILFAKKLLEYIC